MTERVQEFWKVRQGGAASALVVTSAETVTEHGLALFMCGCVLTRKNPTE